MLGAQSWFLALGIPLMAVGGFVASRKRLAYQWKEELLDPESLYYPPLLPSDLADVARVTPLEQQQGIPVTVQDGMGLHVKKDVLPPELVHVLLNEVRDWVGELGNFFDERKVAVFRNTLLLGKEEMAANPDHKPLRKILYADEFDASFYGKQIVISDHAEDIQLMKAPWGCGDKIDYSKMPSSLRFLINQTQLNFRRLGRLRHVYIEYSPDGKFYRDPKAAKHFDGHDVVLVPLRRDMKGMVVTFSPLFRSKHAFLPDVMGFSWTNKDIDCLLQSGSMLRSYGVSRYDWGWGVRPGRAWFGNRHNLIHKQEESPLRKVMETLKLTPKSATENSDAALIALHFEGPSRSKKRPRSLLLEPERWIFGKMPTPESYSQWIEDRPTEDQVNETGLIRFVLMNYGNMLKSS